MINPEMIQKLDRALEMFGGDDCVSCVEGDNKTNKTRSAEDESEKKKVMKNEYSFISSTKLTFLR